jgi:hypothetical protein
MKTAFFLALLSVATAQAEEITGVLQPQLAPAPTARAGESQSSLWSRAKSRLSGSYGGLLIGPTLQHLDGNTDGRGSFVSLQNYLSLEGRLDQNWRLHIGGEFRQTWRPEDPRRPDRKSFEARDPHLGLSRRNIIRGDTFSLGARARYFFPLSENTKYRVGRRNDAGRGELNIGLSPAWRLMGGDIYISCGTNFYYKFAERPPAVRENYSVRLWPALSYRISSKLAAKLEYSTGYLRHTTDGKWTKLNDRFYGQKIFAGGVWSPTRNLSFNPSLGWGSHTFRLNNPELSLFTSYYFL